jgi:hypothetical protein
MTLRDVSQIVAAALVGFAVWGAGYMHQRLKSPIDRYIPDRYLVQRFRAPAWLRYLCCNPIQGGELEVTGTFTQLAGLYLVIGAPVLALFVQDFQLRVRLLFLPFFALLVCGLVLTFLMGMFRRY